MGTIDNMIDGKNCTIKRVDKVQFNVRPSGLNHLVKEFSLYL